AELATSPGAVYSPVASMAPSGGWIDQVTAVLLTPATVAVSCCDAPAASVNVVGVKIRPTGVTVAVALAVTAGSAALCAVIVTVVGFATRPGAVKSPAALTEPRDGWIDQVTAVLPAPTTV